MANIESFEEGERPKEFKNVTFDEIKIVDTAELTVTMKQNQIDVAAIVSGDVDAFNLKGDGDSRADLRKTEAAGAEALISIVLGTKLPGPGTKILHRDLDFAGDVAVGDTLTAKVKAQKKKKHLVVFESSCGNQSGAELVSGTVTVQAPTSRFVYDNIFPDSLKLRWGGCFRPAH
ncbi:MAG: Phosphate acetyl/butyryltransferase family protein [Deltaproteobacteria bacterium]|nr:Phosphate acetyl/butyryltransferase family protein [Deltaproteobacteria bacterium]